MKRGPWQVALGLDYLLNALTWGSVKQTVSARAGYADYRGKRWARLVVPVIDAIFGGGHCHRQAVREQLIRP